MQCVEQGMNALWPNLMVTISTERTMDKEGNRKTAAATITGGQARVRNTLKQFPTSSEYLTCL